MVIVLSEQMRGMRIYYETLDVAVEVKCEHFGRWWVAFQRSHNVPASTLVHGRRHCSRTRPPAESAGGLQSQIWKKKFSFHWTQQL